MSERRDTALELPHIHDDEAQLVGWCPGCIRRVTVDQLRAELAGLDDVTLITEHSSLEGPPVSVRNVIADEIIERRHPAPAD